MKNKKDRLSAISDIVQHLSIGCQEDLLRELNLRGYQVTQATLSRDLKQLRIAKVATREGDYVYVMPDVAATFRGRPAPHIIPPQTVAGVLSIECSNVLIVIRTKPGYASSIASDIDQSSLPEVMGTIAGDDTILVIPRADYSPPQVAEALCTALPKRR